MFLNLSPPSYFETNVLNFLSFKSWISLSTVNYGFILVQHFPIDNFLNLDYGVSWDCSDCGGAPVQLTEAENAKALHSVRGPARTIHHPQTKE